MGFAVATSDREAAVDKGSPKEPLGGQDPGDRDQAISKGGLGIVFLRIRGPSGGLKQRESYSCPEPSHLDKVDIDDIALASEVVCGMKCRSIEVGSNAWCKRW